MYSDTMSHSMISLLVWTQKKTETILCSSAEKMKQQIPIHQNSLAPWNGSLSCWKWVLQSQEAVIPQYPPHMQWEINPPNLFIYPNKSIMQQNILFPNSSTVIWIFSVFKLWTLPSPYKSYEIQFLHLKYRADKIYFSY